MTTLTNDLGIVIGFVVAFIVIFWLSLIIWTFRDIRSRTQDLLAQILATLLVTVFFIGGLFIYMILRPRQTLAEIYERQLEEESLLAEMTERQTCNNCHARVESDFQVCPSCGQKMKRPCPSASACWNCVGPSVPIAQPILPAPTDAKYARHARYARHAKHAARQRRCSDGRPKHIDGARIGF